MNMVYELEYLVTVVLGKQIDKVHNNVRCRHVKNVRLCLSHRLEM